MNPVAAIINEFTTSLCDNKHFSPEVCEAEELIARIPGWSNAVHYLFFRALLTAASKPPRILVCGVYHGLDLALIDLASRRVAKYAPRSHELLAGVDLFSDKPCADWTEQQLVRKTWKAAHNCEPPSIESARKNNPEAVIVMGDSAEFLAANAARFDTIFLDTSHDLVTVRNEITAIKASGFHGIVAGDDYFYLPGHGVKVAVTELLPDHLVIFNRIWLAQIS